jgi:hypothetical protein
MSNNNVILARMTESDIDHDDFMKPKELGNIGSYRVVLYLSKYTYITGYTFITDLNTKETVGHIEHKMPTQHSRLALSIIRKLPGASFQMTDVLLLLLKSGKSLESDNTNTKDGAHKMLMRLASVYSKCHIEDGNGNVVHTKGPITSLENQKLFAISSSNPDFLDNNVHKYILVFEE